LRPSAVGARRGCYRFATTRAVETVDRGLVSKRNVTPIRVEGELNRCVPELALYVAGDSPLLQEQARERVPKGVGRKVGGQSDGLEGTLEGLVDVVPVEWSASRPREHPGRQLMPSAPQRLRSPFDRESAQPLSEFVRHVDRSAVSTLRGIEPSVREGAGHPNLTVLEVEILPL
jgi:hypothetical protein